MLGINSPKGDEGKFEEYRAKAYLQRNHEVDWVECTVQIRSISYAADQACGILLWLPNFKIPGEHFIKQFTRYKSHLANCPSHQQGTIMGVSFLCKSKFFLVSRINQSTFVIT